MYKIIYLAAEKLDCHRDTETEKLKSKKRSSSLAFLITGALPFSVTLCLCGNAFLRSA